VKPLASRRRIFRSRSVTDSLPLSWRRSTMIRETCLCEFDYSKNAAAGFKPSGDRDNRKIIDRQQDSNLACWMCVPQPDNAPARTTTCGALAVNTASVSEPFGLWSSDESAWVFWLDTFLDFDDLVGHETMRLTMYGSAA
jgi:hypothetical protein